MSLVLWSIGKERSGFWWCLGACFGGAQMKISAPPWNWSHFCQLGAVLGRVDGRIGRSRPVGHVREVTLLHLRTDAMRRIVFLSHGSCQQIFSVWGGKGGWALRSLPRVRNRACHLPNRRSRLLPWVTGTAGLAMPTSSGGQASITYLPPSVPSARCPPRMRAPSPRGPTTRLRIGPEPRVEYPVADRGWNGHLWRVLTTQPPWLSPGSWLPAPPPG